MEISSKVIYNYGVNYSIQQEIVYILEQIEKGIYQEATVLNTLLQLPFIYMFFSFLLICILNRLF